MEDAEKLARNFFMPIEDVFEVTGRGVVVTGRISYGEIYVGNRVLVYKSNVYYEATVIGIEMFRKLLDRGEFGDNVGLLLKGVTAKQMENADYIVRVDEDQSDVFIRRCLACGCWTAGKIGDSLSLKALRTMVKNPGKIVGGTLTIAGVPQAVGVGGAVDGIFKDKLEEVAGYLEADVCYECPKCGYTWQMTKEESIDEDEAFEDEIEDFESEAFDEDEITYLETVKECLEEDNKISPRERRLLEKLRVKLGISEERAKELEATLSAFQLTAEEQEYLEEYRACLEEDGEISPKERRLLDKLRMSLGISEERARELENNHL